MIADGKQNPAHCAPDCPRQPIHAPEKSGWMAKKRGDAYVDLLPEISTVMIYLHVTEPRACRMAANIAIR